MSMREGASFNVLAWQSDLETLMDESREGQSLGSAPINTFALLDGLSSELVNLFDLGVEFPVAWEGGDFISYFSEEFSINTGVLDLTPLGGDS